MFVHANGTKTLPETSKRNNDVDNTNYHEQICYYSIYFFSFYLCLSNFIVQFYIKKRKIQKNPTLRDDTCVTFYLPYN